MHSTLVAMVLYSNVLVNATGNAVSEIINTKYAAGIESISLRAASVTGTANVKLEFQTSDDGVNFDSYTDNGVITASTLTEKPNNTEGFNNYILPPLIPVVRYIRFKVTGVGSNPADTRVDAYLNLREAR